MASEQGGVSTAAPVFSASISAPATVAPTTDTAPKVTSEPGRAKSLKRSRPESTQHSGNLKPIANAGLTDFPPPKSPRYKGAFASGYQAAPLTGAAAMEDERRIKEESQRSQSIQTSENPGHKVMSSLLASGGTAMSKPTDAPVSTTVMSEGMSAAANAILIASPMQYEEKAETSPASVTSLASLGSTAQTATASPTVVASPAAMTTGPDDSATPNVHPGNSGHGEDQPSNRALTFPGNVLGQSDPPRAPPRGMSLPMPGQQLAPRSPNQKKHKCPYCETEFTRHHNLKSHLLTHSHEKPYVCETCSMRFRRLHDLKRHTKLHTGERPHICPKCDRKFARGDALARHSKGQGGCAGRRASMGSFGGDEDFEGSNPGEGEEGMDGIMYTNGTPHTNDTEMTEEDRRRLSLPSIKAQHVPGNAGVNYTQTRTPSTYPPAGPRPGQSAGGLYPPPARDRAGSSSSGNSPSMQNSMVSGHTPNTSISSMPLSTGGSIYSQGGMTESPKPLSPSAMQSHQLGHDSSLNRQRSPSLTTQFQQQHFGRRPSGRGSPPVMSLPSSHSSSQGPKLPALTNLAPPEQRYTLSSHTSQQQNPQNGSHAGQHIQPPLGPTSPSVYQPPPAQMTGNVAQGAPQQQDGGSGSNSANLFAKDPNEMWQYVQSLENRVKELQEQVSVLENRERNKDDHINRLSEEIFSLRNQLGVQNQPQHSTAGHS